MGVAALLARLAVGTVRAHLLVRTAANRDGMLTSCMCAAPVTVGWLRPSVILLECWREWPREQLEAVLMHEREHARRRDPLVQWLALLNRAIFWFHPLAWWLERRLSGLAEEACDAVVLAQGHDPYEYSEYLLEIRAVGGAVGRAGECLGDGDARQFSVEAHPADSGRASGAPVDARANGLRGGGLCDPVGGICGRCGGSSEVGARRHERIRLPRQARDTDVRVFRCWPPPRPIAARTKPGRCARLTLLAQVQTSTRGQRVSDCCRAGTGAIKIGGCWSCISDTPAGMTDGDLDEVKSAPPRRFCPHADYNRKICLPSCSTVARQVLAFGPFRTSAATAIRWFDDLGKLIVVQEPPRTARHRESRLPGSAVLRTAIQMFGSLSEKKESSDLLHGRAVERTQHSQAEVQATIDAAQRAHVAIYPIDARGLIAPPPAGRGPAKLDDKN